MAALFFFLPAAVTLGEYVMCFPGSFAPSSTITQTKRGYARNSVFMISQSAFTSCHRLTHAALKTDGGKANNGFLDICSASPSHFGLFGQGLTATSSFVR